MLDTIEYAQALTEAATRFTPSALPYDPQSLNITHSFPRGYLDEVPKLEFHLWRSFSPTTPGYEYARAWLENDPRTTLTSGKYLTIEHQQEFPTHTLNYSINVHLTSDEIDLLRSLGKLIPSFYTYTAVAC